MDFLVSSLRDFCKLNCLLFTFNSVVGKMLHLNLLLSYSTGGGEGKVIKENKLYLPNKF